MRITISSVFLGATIIACGCSLFGREEADTVSPVLPSARLYYDDGPAFTDSTRLVVRDPAVWQDVWAQATSIQASPPPLPEIDFEREMVLLVAAGRMNPGDQIHVDSAGVRGELFVALVRTVVECEPFAADAYPFEIVRVKREDKAVNWVDRREQAAHCLERR